MVMTVREAYAACRGALKTDNAAFEAKQMIMYLLGVDNSGFIMNMNKSFSADKSLALKDMVSRRNGGEPLYYILGECEFYSLPFKVGEGVLIPRQDTELLCDTALEHIAENPRARVLELCAGSGCISVAVAKNAPSCRVDAVELYEPAYTYLCENIRLNRADNVTPIKADALTFSGEYDLVLSNPPYIARRERRELSAEVLREPDTALFADNDGLLFYQKIAANDFGKNFTLCFEIGETQGAAVEHILISNGFRDIEIKNDLCGHQRVVIGKK